MKGIYGLILAVFLGMVGLVLNWLYLDSKIGDIKSERFIGIKKGVTIRPGEKLRASFFEPVEVPSSSYRTQNLKQFIFTYDEVDTINGIPATRSYEYGDVVLRGDYRTAAKEVSWFPESQTPRDRQKLIWVTIDDSEFVPSLVDPGDNIWFVVPEAAARVPTSAVPGSDQIELKAHDIIGPFRVGSLGTRLGSRDLMHAERRSRSNERQVGIVVSIERNSLGAEDFDAQTKQLLMLRERTSNRGLTVVWSPTEEG